MISILGMLIIMYVFKSTVALSKLYVVFRAYQLLVAIPTYTELKIQWAAV